MKNNSYYYQTIRALERKLYLVNIRGGKCQVCGYCKNLAALDIHHVNPELKEKLLDSRNLSNSSMKSIFIEFEKCIILCANCHREHHNPECEMSVVNSKSSEFRKSIDEPKIYIKPKCIDCGINISYLSKRCRKCKSLKSRVKNRPDKIKLIEELKNSKISIISRKHGVSHTTINRWIK